MLGSLFCVLDLGTPVLQRHLALAAEVRNRLVHDLPTGAVTAARARDAGRKRHAARLRRIAMTAAELFPQHCGPCRSAWRHACTPRSTVAAIGRSPGAAPGIWPDQGARTDCQGVPGARTGCQGVMTVSESPHSTHDNSGPVPPRDLRQRFAKPRRPPGSGGRRRHASPPRHRRCRRNRS